MAFETRALTGTMLAQRYVVGELQRETDFATQFRGEDRRTGRAVNVDVVREGLGAESHASKTLAREAMMACEIRHPNVVTPSDVGVLDDGSTFVITPSSTGETLEDRMCLSGSLPVGDVVRIGLDLLSAMAAAHDLQITHGDLRPELVFVVERDGLVLQTLLSGFGHRSRTDTKGFANLSFVAPEVAAGQAPTASSDIYACGAILYLAATGYLPFGAELPARLERVLVQALQVDPKRRFASARDMLHVLEVARDAVHGAVDTTAEPAALRWTKSDVVPSLRALASGVERGAATPVRQRETAPVRCGRGSGVGFAYR